MGAVASRQNKVPQPALRGLAPAGKWNSRWRNIMDAPRQYRQQEVFCLRLASEATEDYVKTALTELAADYRHKAEDAERRGYAKAA
jgi:hypothetical protein